MGGLEVEDEEWVKQCLKEYERRRCISKVLSVSSEDAVPKGNNYASDLYRLKLKVVLHSGDIEERPVIFKSIPATPGRFSVVKKSGIYAKEAKVYKELFPVIDSIRRNKGDDEPLAACCYAVKPKNEGFLLEDLSVQGYKLANKMKGLDFEHARLALNALAKFHALSAIAIENADISRSDYGNSYFSDPSSGVHALVVNNLEDLSSVLEHKWGGEWVEYASRLRKLKETYRDSISKFFEVDESKFYTITHGDFGILNMLFKYGVEGIPTGVRLVDFQMASGGRPGTDIHYFLEISLGPGSLSRKPELLRTYYDLLVSHLQRFGYSSETPTFEDIKEGFDKVALFTLAVALAFRPFVICDSDDAPDVERLSTGLENKSISAGNFSSDNEYFVASVKAILLDAKENGYL